MQFSAVTEAEPLQNFKELKWESLHYLPYYSSLVTSDFHLFQYLYSNKHWKELTQYTQLKSTSQLSSNKNTKLLRKTIDTMVEWRKTVVKSTKTIYFANKLFIFMWAWTLSMTKYNKIITFHTRKNKKGMERKLHCSAVDLCNLTS